MKIMVFPETNESVLGKDLCRRCLYPRWRQILNNNDRKPNNSDIFQDINCSKFSENFGFIIVNFLINGSVVCLTVSLDLVIGRYCNCGCPLINISLQSLKKNAATLPKEVKVKTFLIADPATSHQFVASAHVHSTRSHF